VRERARELYADHWLGFSEVKVASPPGKRRFPTYRGQRCLPGKAEPALSDRVRHGSEVNAAGIFLSNLRLCSIVPCKPNLFL